METDQQFATTPIPPPPNHRFGRGLLGGKVERGRSILISMALGLFIACHRSQSCCRPSQKSADIPNTRDSLSAVSGVTDLRPLIISFKRGYETPSLWASSVWVMLRGLINSSKSISPGCVGGRFVGSFLDILLVVVCNFDIIYMSFLPNKTILHEKPS